MRTQEGVVRILDTDTGWDEVTALEDTQRAVLNVLDDFGTEKARLESTQQAVLNILDDLNAEKSKLEEASALLKGEIEERRKAAAQLEAVNKELEAFSYSVSHDLRAPLRAIDGFSLALLEDYTGQLDAQGQDFLHRVRAGVQKMGQLIDDMLQLSRLTRGEIHIAPVNLSAVAREIIEEQRRNDPTRRVEFLCADGLGASGDGRLLRAALSNLLNNAWKFTGKQSETRIEFGTTATEDGPAFFIRDNGAGFDMAYAHKLFGAFQRLHRAEEFPGTGIGLAIVHRIIHRHGGRVWAEGAVGKGAVFYFTLPTSATIREETS
ncbi:MAG: hypothetical protein EPO64_06430 [Nitrospirae bacterium]|nr:MAG: hypothetical protein EPO64_06430 [Nitrospirota bacterium]